MQIKLTTGERLTDLRREHNLTLEQVSEQTGIVKSTLSNYENDKKPDINLVALEKLAALYGVGLDYLLGLNENKKHSGTSLADLHLEQPHKISTITGTSKPVTTVRRSNGSKRLV